MPFAAPASQLGDEHIGGIFFPKEGRGDSAKRPAASSHIFVPLKASHKRVDAQAKAQKHSFTAMRTQMGQVAANLLGMLAPMALPNAQMLIPKFELRRDAAKPSRLIKARVLQKSATLFEYKNDDEGRIRVSTAVLGGKSSPFPRHQAAKGVRAESRHASTPSTPHNARLFKRPGEDGPHFSG